MRWNAGSSHRRNFRRRRPESHLCWRVRNLIRVADQVGGIMRFLSRGGSVLIAGVRPNAFVPQSSAEEGDARIGFAECKPVAPTRLTRGGPISQDGDLAWDSGKDAALVHFRDKNKDEDGRAVVVSYAVGQGRVIWWASALPLTNAGIRNRKNLDLLLNSVGDSRRILWDEYYHEEHVIDSAVRKLEPRQRCGRSHRLGFSGCW